MFRKKNGQEFMDELNVDSSVNDKEEKKGFFHRRKKKEINLYEDDMGYIEEDGDFSEEEYDKELDELQEDEKPEKRKRRFWHRKKEDTPEEAQTEVFSVMRMRLFCRSRKRRSFLRRSRRSSVVRQQS